MSYDASTPILGRGTVSAEAIDAWFADRGPSAAEQYAPDKMYKPAPTGLGAIIIAESQRWPSHVVNHDLIAADIAHESAFWQSAIVRDKHNPSGLGAVNNNAYQGAVTFTSPREGVRATVAHMLSYAVGDGPWASTDPRYAAVQREGWLGTAPRLSGLNGKWAFPGKAYGQQIATLANRLVSFANDGNWNMAGDDERFAWVPDTREFGYPQGTRGRNGRAVDYLIIHVTEGTNSLGWLTGNNGSSAHYLTNRDATPRAQMVREADAAWTAGSREYNERGINVEFERFARDPWTDAEYRNAAATCYPILQRHNIPMVALGRNHASRRGIIGHEHVPDPDGSGWGGAGNHTDPGPQFDWGRFVAELKQLEPSQPEPAPDPDALHFPETGFAISGGFRAYWEQFGGLAVFGYPITSEYEENGVTIQWFERARFEWHPGSWPERYDVLCGLLGVELLAARERIEELEETG